MQRVGRLRRKVRAFIAAPPECKKQAKAIANSISRAKHIVTSTWVYQKENKPDWWKANNDLIDVMRSDVVVVLTGFGSSRVVDFIVGWACAHKVAIALIGKDARKLCYYYSLPEFMAYDTWTECRDSVFPIPEYVRDKRVKQLKALLASKRRNIQARWQSKEQERLRELKELEQMEVRD